jgi:hypothetical protein
MRHLLATSLIIRSLLIPRFAFSQIVLGDTTLSTVTDKESLEYTAPIDPEVAASEDPTLHVGGALRFNYQYRDWSEAHAKQGGAFTFDTWRINVDAQARGILLSLEYRFYSGFHLFHHGWMGYNFSPKNQIQVGITQVPFGLLPYASHSWWFQTAYYLGLEDDYDMGAKFTHQGDRWRVDVAYFKNAEPTLSGSSQASARFSYDVVPASIIQTTSNIILTPGTPGPDQDSVLIPSLRSDTTLYSPYQEVNQVNLRVAYDVLPNLELGASLQGSGIYHQDLDQTGSHRAIAGHLDWDFHNFNLLAEYIYYDYQLPTGPGQGGRQVVMGAYDLPYRVASQAQLFMAGLSYSIPVEWGPISNLTVYDNYAYTDKAEADFADSQQHAIGCLINTGQLFTYVDVASGRNHPWLGPFGSHWFNSLGRGAEGAGADEWHTRVNVNLGYYF